MRISTETTRCECETIRPSINDVPEVGPTLLTKAEAEAIKEKYKRKMEVFMVTDCLIQCYDGREQSQGCRKMTTSLALESDGSFSWFWLCRSF